MNDITFSEHSIIESQEYESSLDHSVKTDRLTESLRELSRFEDSGDISGSNHDVFSFCDDTPPTVQAFDLREEDLFEESSEISKELSLISSDLQTSGCSTESEPFGNLHFIEPLMTSTPRKQKERPRWFQKKFEDFQSVKEGKFHFILHGHGVCLKSWLIAHGIKKSIYYKERKTWMTRDEGPLSSVRKLTSEKRLHAINWFGEYIAMRGENPPHIQEIWLPFGLRKNEVYSRYEVETEEESRDRVSYQTFLNIWKDHFSHVKIKQSNLFTRCTTCDKLDRELHKQLNPEKKRDIFIKKQEHLHRQMKEKSAYYRRKTVSRRRPDRYISLIIDGMDQSKTNIPHFKGRPSKGKSLPPVLYLQADNCFRENKNKFVLSFLELLVRRRIFYEVQLSFLHVGHTHEDIDQMFSVIADNLRHKDAATLPEMSDILYSAEELRGCFDISGWLSPCLKGVKYHTRTNTFRYRLNEMTGDVHIYYRKNVDHSWKTLNGSFFKQRVDGSIMMPTAAPPLLLASFEKIDIQNIKKSLSIWSKMMSVSENTWWEKFISLLGQSQGNTNSYSRKGAIWYLPKIPNYNPHALQDTENNHPAVPEDLQRLLTNEDENPEVTFFL
uniref:DUF7869 domain-containing protein n=1 Tax=Magallana gigas TaxID=29159 RepID=A0A8W8JJX8_MAGGI